MARLVSVNVGLPKKVAWHGASVYTGVWKAPVAGPRHVRRLNIDGDGQGDLAGHGGEMRAVLVYQLASYRYWQQVLQRDDLAPGHFGENFTVDGLADDKVCIGDRYRIGTAVFEVTQPRVTCYRVGLRLNEPRMPALLVAHGRPGFYLRVLTEGEVEPGQEIVKISDGPGQMTVAEIDALLYRPPHPADRVEQALRIEALSPGWQQSFTALLDQARAGSRLPTGANAGLSATDTAPPAWEGFRRLVVRRIDQETPHLRSLWLAAADGQTLPAAAPGQYLTLRLRITPDGPPLTRSYSLSGPPGADLYRITVKREAKGAASTFLHTCVQIGDRLEAAAARGTFTLRPGSGPLVLASAGVGITPVLAMLHALAEAGSSRPIWWLHGARNRPEQAFVEETSRLLTRLEHARAAVFYSRPQAADALGANGIFTGRLTADVLDTLEVPNHADVYLCGPTAFLEEMTAALLQRGFATPRLHTEVFGAGPSLTPGLAPTTARPPHSPSGPTGQGPAVRFARSGLSTSWSSRYGSLLELAEACDVPVRWSCRTGVCRTCETGLIDGGVRYSPDPIEQPPSTSALICCAQPDSDLTLDL